MATENPTVHIGKPDRTLAALSLALMSGASLNEADIDLTDAANCQFGAYKLVEYIGGGGMGVVYRAHQTSLERDVAIKLLNIGRSDNAVALARFQFEAKSAAALNHPNIVQVLEIGQEQGIAFIAMQLVRGKTLADRIRDNILTTTECVALMLKLCDAVGYAHRLHLLHLDLKPANVLIDERNEPMVADFGLARRMDARGQVQAQEVSGTPSYMAPEQMMIKEFRLSAATDIYALGAILYEMLCGVAPHGKGNVQDVMQRALAGQIPRPRDVRANIPRDLEAICLKCLNLEAKSRYPHIEAVSEDLRRYASALPVSVRVPTWRERMQRWYAREPKVALSTSLAALALIIGAAATTWQWKQAAAGRDRAAIASEIGAHLFAYKGEDDARAADLIAWLRKRLPGDENRQAEALTQFATSVDAEGRESAELLLTRVSDVLGTDYRRKMIQALKAGADPYRHLYIALMAWRDEHDSADPETFSAALQAAIDEHPSDPLVWQVAAVYCPGPKDETRCLKPQAAEVLTRLDPDNMFSWLLLAMTSNDGQRARDALHAAATRARFDDYHGATFAAYARAVDAAAVPAPQLIAQPLRVLAPNERAASNIALAEAEGLVLPPYQRLIDQCGVRVGATLLTDQQVLADCLTVGKAMMRSNGGLMTRMIGLVPVKALAKGTPEAEEAFQIRRLYTYLDEAYQKLSPSQRASYPSSLYMNDVATEGEMVALQRRAKFFGLPDQTPVNWKPDNPLWLQTTGERYENVEAINRKAAALVAQGNFAEAVALLASAEKPILTSFKTDWHGVRYLTTLAKAKIGLRDFHAAQSALDDAWNVAWKFGPPSRDARDCAHAYVDLYTAWNASAPGNGYDLRTAEWRRRVDGLEAAKDN